MMRACLTAILVLSSSMASAATLPSPNWPDPADRGEALLRQVVLDSHNRVRSEFGVAPVTWSDELATDAEDYAAQMARTGVYRHDPTPGRRKFQGENLWRGQRGLFDYRVMIGTMIEEGRYFRNGRFPNVSRTGSWHDVGHFTQIVWPATTEVGCAVESNRRYDFLVCRYAPAGNKDGKFL